MYDVVAIGELLIDFTWLGNDGSGYPTLAAHPGGAPANYLAAAAKLGGKAAMLGKVGDDAFGTLLTETLEKAGIAVDGIRKSRDVFTTLAFVTLTAEGDREFSFSRKPGADTMLREDELDWEILRQAKVLHFGTLSLTDEPARTATRKAIAYAEARGIIRTFDPNLRAPLWASLQDAKEEMLWGLQHADIVKISDEEVRFLWEFAPEEGAAYILQNFPVKLVFVTCGEDGCWFRNQNASGHVDSLHGIQTADTTGAGDIFFGSAMWKLLQTNTRPDDLNGEQLREIAQFAAVSAGLSTTKPGGISSVTDLKEITAVLEKNTVGNGIKKDVS